MTNQPTESETTPENISASPPTFDERAASTIKEWTRQLMVVTPELRSVTVVFDWNGALNDAQIQHGIWQSRLGGGNMPPDAIFGSLLQTLKVAEQQLASAYTVVDQLRAMALEASRTVRDATEAESTDEQSKT